MNGPEHYAEAERLLGVVARPSDWPYDSALLLRKAQVHATLALAAAQLTTAHAAGSSAAGDHTQAGRAVGRWALVLPDLADRPQS